MKEKIVKDWKQQMFEVRKVGEERSITRPPWKKYRPPEIKGIDPDGRKES